ncbi:HlyD family efflux transporter periplasmic adaptor subunit [Acetobacterium tundrae]|uniref:HlyD family efflux transporter periplasmic adaptor subunit n=1 Tax=Acetobacterium tundrae TaxID=132932 RepID=A0ABR6WKD2_9FIRM|nr:HlyD family efflux transporter periplasmic adaptor subunit [Acetobacterium tundrae]MBC3796944.1 HlyD family efflux transporter periplasmic adaptor subunit [Acetobacterium tundrae]
MSKSIFQKKEDKSTKKNEQAALMTVIGPKNLLILLGILIFLIGVVIFSVTVPIKITTTMAATIAYGEGAVGVVGQNEGVLTEITVSEGDYVNKGDLLGVVTMESLGSEFSTGIGLTDEEKSKVKRQTMIYATESGVVEELNYQEGETLQKNAVFCQIEKTEGENTPSVIIAYSTYEAAQTIQSGDAVYIALETAPTAEYGYLKGVVRNVQINKATENVQNPLQMKIIIDPKVDDKGTYIWTKDNNGFNGQIKIGTSCQTTIFTDKYYLINLIIS